jgi:exopolysaccharide production protein ExoQ
MPEKVSLMRTDIFVEGYPEKWVPQPFDRTGRLAAESSPIWRLAKGWILLFPMLYLAMNGNIFAGANGGSSTTEAGGDSSALHKISLLLVSVIFITVISSCKAPLIGTLLRSKLVLSLPLLALCSSFWSEQPMKSLVGGAILLSFTVFTICIAAEFKFQRQVELIILSGAVVLPLSIAFAVLVPSVGTTPAGWSGVFGQKQLCAAISTLWLITALHWRCHGFHRRFTKPLYILMCAVLIVMSQSRTGWLLALVAVLLWAVLSAAQRVRRLEVVLGVAVSVPIILATAYIVFTQYGLLASSLGKDSTLSQRTIIWKAVWESIVQRPYLGYGFSAFWSGLNGPSQRVVLISDWGIQQAQNGYLDLWLGLGVGGVVIITLMAALAIRTFFKTVPMGESRSQLRWCTVIIITILLYNIGETFFGLLQMVWFLFLLAFIGLQSLGRKRNRWEPTPE